MIFANIEFEDDWIFQEVFNEYSKLSVNYSIYDGHEISLFLNKAGTFTLSFSGKLVYLNFLLKDRYFPNCDGVEKLADKYLERINTLLAFI